MFETTEGLKKIDWNLELIFTSYKMLSKAKYQANERYFLQMMQITKKYGWIDKGHFYILTSKTIKPLTQEGYNDLAEIVRPSFLTLFVLTPDK